MKWAIWSVVSDLRSRLYEARQYCLHRCPHQPLAAAKFELPLNLGSQIRSGAKWPYGYKKIRYLQLVGSYGLYYIMQLSKRSVIQSGSDTVSKLQTSDVRSCHSNWPGDLAFKGRRSLLAHNVLKRMTSCQISWRCAPQFFHYLRKTSGGYLPPVGARFSLFM